MDYRSAKKRKRRMRRFFLFLLMLIPIFYIGLQILLMLKSDCRTQTAIADVMSDSVTCDGMLAMQEMMIPQPGTGVMGYLAENGERVSAGAEVARVFADEQSARSRAAAEKLTEQIEVLHKSQAGNSPDMESLMKQQQQEIYAALDILESGNYADLSETGMKIQTVQNKMQLTMGTTGGFDAQIEALTAQRDAANAASVYTPVTAPQTGYFVSAQDSEKQFYTPEVLDAMQPSELSGALEQPHLKNDAGYAGKLILDYRWNYYGVVTLKQAEKFTEGKKVKLSFPDISEDSFPAVVTQIIEDEENGIAKVGLSCDYINDTVVALEHMRAEITFASYEGLRIDREALHIVEGQNCVFVKFGNVLYQKNITILFENEDYILIPAEYDRETNAVKMFDEVVVRGSDLYDKKIL